LLQSAEFSRLTDWQRSCRGECNHDDDDDDGELS